MKTTTNPEGRKNLLKRHSPWGYLPRFIILLLAIHLIPAFWFVSCRSGILDMADPVRIDSAVTAIVPSEKFLCADLFIYRDAGVRELIHSERYNKRKDTLLYKGLAGVGLLYVLIENCKTGFNVEGLQRYDSMEVLLLDYEDEDPSSPMAVCCGTMVAGDTMKVYPKPFLTKIVLDAISQEFPNYKRLEDPRVILQGASEYVEALRTEGFRKTYEVSDTLWGYGKIWKRLPYDIGMYEQHPGTTVFCYPFEDSVSPMKYIVEGEFDGRTVKFTKEISQVTRGHDLHLSLEIGNSPEDYSFR